MDNTPPSRRDFLKSSSALLAGTALSAPSILRGASPDSKLKIGFIGCGGRGTGAANQALKANPNNILWAVGDAFEDKLTASLEGLKQNHTTQVDVPESRQFVGLDAYQKVIDSGVDVVLLTTPPRSAPFISKQPSQRANIVS